MKKLLVFLMITLPVTTALLTTSCNNNTKPMNAETKVPAFDLSTIDSTVKPCDDFDGYANGNWKKHNPIPSTEGSWGSFDILDKETREVKIKGIIKELLTQENPQKGSEAQLITGYYRSYLDTVTIAKRGITPIVPMSDKIVAAHNVAELVSFTGELAKYMVDGPFSVYVGADDRNSTMNAIFMGQSGLSLNDRNYYENKDSAMVKIRAEFVKHVDKMFSMAGWQVADPGKTILDFETKLALIQLKNFELRDPVKIYNKIPFAELKKIAPGINWGDYYKNYGLNADTVIVQDKNYLKSLNQLVGATPLDVMKTYYRWQLLSTYANLLPSEFNKETFHFFSTVMYGVKEQRPREERAIMSVNRRLGMPLGKLFVAKYFPESSKKKVSDMIENVRSVYSSRIDNLAWMSAPTKEKAKKKLAAFTWKIGYPDKWKDYSSIDIQADKLIENSMNIALWDHQDMISKAGKPVDKSEWGMSPQTINAYNNPTNNEIVFPAAILQPPFFNPDADDAINYGAIIGVIGHEMTHGFDDQGAQYDGTGNLSNWWTPEDTKNFTALGKKMEDYFSSIEVTKGFHIDGKLTLGENIADLGGLTLGYYALEKSLEGKKKPDPIDGFTYQQRFFLGWAQVWRDNMTNESLINQVQTNEHTPARWRINATLPLMKEFADAFGCKGTAAESQRIVIW
ncbi:MAG: M13 family metallopeptidase [Bacteroidetes bacterium]|nr:M13 family metallopeptidase [Bacteroidota bacterium]